jgi:hypothetical protein
MTGLGGITGISRTAAQATAKVADSTPMQKSAIIAQRTAALRALARLAELRKISLRLHLIGPLFCTLPRNCRGSATVSYALRSFLPDLA